MAAAALELALASVLLAVTVTDLDRRVIPKAILLAGAVVGIAIVAPTGPGQHARASCRGGRSRRVPPRGGRQTRGDGNGGRQARGAHGPSISGGRWPALAVAFAAGGLAGLGLVLRHGAQARTWAVPFGPFLAAGGIVGLFAGDEVFDWRGHVHRLTSNSRL